MSTYEEAFALHLRFTSLMKGGFTERQALLIIIGMICTGPTSWTPPDTPKRGD